MFRIDAGALKILIVEDNPINQMVLARLVESLGFPVEIACDGREAVRAAERGNFDLIFMDCQMPEMDGFTATRKIRNLSITAEEHRAAGQPLIIAMTADTLSGTREKCLASGMDGYLAKPILLETLREILDRAIANKGFQLPNASKGEHDFSEGILPGNARACDEAAGVEVNSVIVERLRVLSENDSPGSFENLVTEFLADAEVKIGALAGLTGPGYSMDLIKSAHALKGLCLNFGALAMARQCDVLQREAGNGDADGILMRLEELSRAMQRTQAALAREIRGGKNPEASADETSAQGEAAVRPPHRKERNG